MKLALDVWYELWERTGSEAVLSPTSKPTNRMTPCSKLNPSQPALSLQNGKGNSPLQKLR